MKKVILSLLFFLTTDIVSHAQMSKADLNHKFQVGVSQGGGIQYLEGSDKKYTINEALFSRIGYFASSYFMPYAGIDAMAGWSTFDTSQSKMRLFSCTVGSRIYFTKKRLVFTETGLRYGNATVAGNAIQHLRFFHMYYAAGLNFFLVQGTSKGRFSLEVKLLQQNLNLIDYKYYGSVGFLIDNLTTGIGINYIFPVTKELETQYNQIRQSVYVQSHHILKGSFPPFLSYYFEYPIGKAFSLGAELCAYRPEGLFDSLPYFVPGINAESRWYYGLAKRNHRGQDVRNNSSDYLALSIFYKQLYLRDHSAKYFEYGIVPKWGLRRALGNHFIFEGSIGLSFNNDIEQIFRVIPLPTTCIGYVF